VTSRHFVWAGADTWIDGSGINSRYTTFIAVSPITVFDYVSDVRKHPEWAANRMTVTPLTPGRIGIGSRYRTVASQGGRDWESIVEITRYEPPRVFEFIAIGGATQEPEDHPHRHTFTLSAVPGGTTLELHRLSRGLDQRQFYMRLMITFFASRLGQWLMPRIAQNIALGQENLKRNLEARAAAGQ
jgi:uncharacterized protein YndB with AHSA1/START domain